MTRISQHCKIRRSCKHAIQVVNAVLSNNFFRFFQLYSSGTCPNLLAYLMDFLLQRVRLSAFPAIIAAYRPILDIRHFVEFLLFCDNNEAILFLRRETNVVLIEMSVDGQDRVFIDCKASQQCFGSSHGLCE